MGQKCKNCEYCLSEFSVKNGISGAKMRFCSQDCARKVKSDRYMWNICSVLSGGESMSAIRISELLSDRGIDLTSMRVATRINSKLIETIKDSEPYEYRLKDELVDTPWMWHSSKFFNKTDLSPEAHSFVYGANI